MCQVRAKKIKEIMLDKNFYFYYGLYLVRVRRTRLESIVDYVRRIL